MNNNVNKSFSLYNLFMFYKMLTSHMGTRGGYFFLSQFYDPSLRCFTLRDNQLISPNNIEGIFTIIRIPFEGFHQKYLEVVTIYGIILFLHIDDEYMDLAAIEVFLAFTSHSRRYVL